MSSAAKRVACHKLLPNNARENTCKVALFVHFSYKNFRPSLPFIKMYTLGPSLKGCLVRIIDPVTVNKDMQVYRLINNFI